MKIRISRRQLALYLAAAIGGSAIGVWSLLGEDDGRLDIDLPAARDPFAPTFEEFVALSKIVLLRTSLDQDVARRLFAIFSDEPWGSKHIGHAYAALRDELPLSGQIDPGDPISLARLGEGERWFVGHLVTTWYLGVYYHEERPTQWVTHTGALMYDAVRGLLPVRYFEGVGYGGWVTPPRGD